MPIKVGDAPQFDPGRSAPVGPASAGAPVDPAAFRQQMAYQSSVEDPDGLDHMVGQVDEQAKRLLNNPSLGELAVYRDMIRKFMKAVSSRLGKLEKRTDRRNRTLVIIRSLDEKLEELTRAILEEQEKGIDLLAKLNEIRGLLLDLLI